MHNKIILLVEDDAVDAMTVSKAFKDLRINVALCHAKTGEAALTRLRDSRTELPRLILLDINMPRMNGIEFLREVKQDPFLRKIPVVMLTTSDEEGDRTMCFGLGAAGYMVKPLDYKELFEIIRTIDLCWAMNRTPSMEHP